MHLEVQHLNLRIVVEKSRRLKRVEEAFATYVIEIASPVIRRIEVRIQRKTPVEFGCTAQAAHRHAAVLSAFTTDQHLIAHMTVIPVNGRRPRKFRAYLAHGAAPLAAAVVVVAVVVVCATEDVPPDSLALYALITFLVASLRSTSTVIISGML